MKLTYEELEKKYEELKKNYEELEKELKKTKVILKQALEKIDELEKRLNKNSKNSSKPPSTDRKANTDSKEKELKKGHKGIARAVYPPERVNRYVKCIMEQCPFCQSSAINAIEGFDILQQAELPEVKAIVTEYQMQKYHCGNCGKNSIANLPLGIPDSAFGPKLMGLVATLTGVFHLAKREAIDLMYELYDVKIAVGSISNIEEKITLALDPIYQSIHRFVIRSKMCKHFDETGWRDSGKNHFAWIATTAKATVYKIDRNRSKEAFNRLIGNIGKNFSAVTDRYAVYRDIEKHQYCLAHLIRNFKGFSERDGPDKEIASTTKEVFRKICHHHKEYREGRKTLSYRNRSIGQCKRKMEKALVDGIANGSDALYKLSDTLLNNFDKLFQFTKVEGMEPTNNLAERDLRKLVIWRKKSYGTRSERGKRFVERITSIAQTLKKHNYNILKTIQEVVLMFYSKTGLHSAFDFLTT